MTDILNIILTKKTTTTAVSVKIARETHIGTEVQVEIIIKIELQHQIIGMMDKLILMCQVD